MTPAFLAFDADAFLRDYWQKKPLLIRNPWAEWTNPLEPDELAGLSCEEHVESRIVAKTDGALTLEHGPFSEDRFDELGTSPWTLLVQAVDHFVPAVADLLEPFRFIPNWRIDDIMVSFATDGGGVGPHFDQYDVFLVQGLGQRRWQIGLMCGDATPLLPHEDLKLLAEFEVQEDWVLEPGDILYVPPRLAHNGTAIGNDCMTYSVGFRAPSCDELIESWAAEALAGPSEDDRYGDPDLRVQGNPGEISHEALARLHEMMTARIADQQGFAEWFGKFATAPKNPNIDWSPDEPVQLSDVAAALERNQIVLRNPASRFAFARHHPDAVTLMVDGQSFVCTGKAAVFAENLCASPRFNIEGKASDEVAALLCTLINLGSAAFEVAED